MSTHGAAVTTWHRVAVVEYRPTPIRTRNYVPYVTRAVRPQPLDLARAVVHCRRIARRPSPTTGAKWGVRSRRSGEKKVGNTLQGCRKTGYSRPSSPVPRVYPFGVSFRFDVRSRISSFGICHVWFLTERRCTPVTRQESTNLMSLVLSLSLPPSPLLSLSFDTDCNIDFRKPPASYVCAHTHCWMCLLWSTTKRTCIGREQAGAGECLMSRSPVSPIARFCMGRVDRLSLNWLVDATCGYVTSFVAG